MAKRRNLKKEKALRNEAYARKFRKRTNKGRFGRKRFGYGNDNRAEDSEGGQDRAMEGAADA
jgi:hypothetical protein